MASVLSTRVLWACRSMVLSVRLVRLVWRAIVGHLVLMTLRRFWLFPMRMA